MRRYLVVIAVIALATGAASGSEAELDALRIDYAKHFFTPEAHLRLAKYLADHGWPLTAFNLSEEARQRHFSEREFARAARAVYRNDPFDDSSDAERALCEAIVTQPTPSASKLRALADIHIARKEWAQAEDLLHQAIALEPESYAPVSTLAALLRWTEREAEGDALDYAWLDARPDSLETWRVRAARIVEQDIEAATATIEEARARFPNDGEILFHYAGLLHDQKRLAEAAVEYERAAALAPSSAYIQGWTARFFLRAMKDREKAVHYYLRAYFLDPEFADTEPVHERVKALVQERASEVARTLGRSSKAIEELLGHPNPFVADLGLDAASLSWWPSYTTPVVLLLEHDDPTLRYSAAALLGRIVHRSADGWLRSVVAREPADPGRSPFGVLTRKERSPGRDLYVRSAAAYIAGGRFGIYVLPMLEPWLTDPSDLLRYDAVSVLAEYGGARGLERLRKLRDSGTVQDARIRTILENIK
ncbi:MAG: hypothetical protein WA208_14780 [Thermoanaerobaculia bacterium]